MLYLTTFFYTISFLQFYSPHFYSKYFKFVLKNYFLDNLSFYIIYMSDILFESCMINLNSYDSIPETNPDYKSSY